MRKISFIVLSIGFLFLQSCDDIRRVTDNIFDANERARYERNYRGADSLLLAWTNAYEIAKQSQLQIPEPFSATVEIGADHQPALAYKISLKRGDQLHVQAQNPLVTNKIFIDFLPANTPGANPKSDLLENQKYQKFIERDGDYTVILQPEIDFTGNIQLQIFTQPSLSFPVVGKGNRDIHSFWGVDRDGGARRHEGVDVFAPRGTPIVAVSDGVVSRTRDQGRGGKQVWQRDGNLGVSIYYAHMDSIIATPGQRVRIGDTLGTVGNTGNAIHTPPHLHFGIYGMGGATDPYPFIRQRATPEFSSVEFQAIQSIKAGSNMREGPGTQYEILQFFENKIPVDVIAAHQDWRHVITASGQHGFISQSRLE